MYNLQRKLTAIILCAYKNSTILEIIINFAKIVSVNCWSGASGPMKISRL